MDSSLTSLLHILAGINIAFAAVNLGIGLQKGSEKSYLFLGLIGAFMSFYYLIYPYVRFDDPMPIIAIIGFLFFILTFALLPWFFGSFTEYNKRYLQIVLSSGMLFAYLLFMFKPSFGPFALWNIIAHISLVAIIIYGIKASLYQRNHTNKINGTILLVGVLSLALLTLDDIIRMHFPEIYPFGFLQNYLPLDYFIVLFVMVMGVKMSIDVQQKYKLEKLNLIKEKRWRNLLERIDLIVVEIDEAGLVKYINPYFTDVSGFEREDILHKNWFEFFIMEEERGDLLLKYQEFLTTQKFKHHQNGILTKAGESLQILWSNLLIRDDDDGAITTLSIGADITEMEKAHQEIKHLKAKLEEENILLKAEFRKDFNTGHILGDSDALKYVLKRSILVAPTSSTVLLEGETGVGKELIANYIQQNSHLVDQVFIKLNCAAIPSSLIESELFGHEKGAFTGANKRKRGMVEMADGGTLFLDEIAELPLDMQAKLLRFLQEGEFLPLGSSQVKKVSVRIITATNKELLSEIDKGTFRNDLYYRLYVYPITIPPLRNRKTDIPILVESFIRKYADKHSKTILKVSKQLMDDFMAYDWPGNIRELENVVERAVIISNSEVLRQKDTHIFENEQQSNAQLQNSFVSLEQLERNHIIKALDQTGWKIHGKNGAAELLHINPNTLRSRMKKMEIYKS